MKQTESTVLFWWGINEGLRADTAASHEHFVRHTVFTPRLSRNYNRNTVRGRQRASALTRCDFTTSRRRGAARCGLIPPPAPHPLLRHPPPAALRASPNGDRGGIRDGNGPCPPPQRGRLKRIPASHTAAMWEGKQTARIRILGGKKLLISERVGHEHSCNCFVTRALTLHVTAAESRACGRVYRLDHSLSMCKTVF